MMGELERVALAVATQYTWHCGSEVPWLYCGYILILMISCLIIVIFNTECRIVVPYNCC